MELLKEKAPEKITVTELIKKADISRGTFYRHYQDVPALWEDICQVIRDAYCAWLSPYFQTDSPKEPDSYTRNIYRYIYDIMLEDNYPQYLMNIVLQVFYERIKCYISESNLYSEEEIQILSTFIVGGLWEARKKYSEAPFIAEIIYMLANANLHDHD